MMIFLRAALIFLSMTACADAQALLSESDLQLYREAFQTAASGQWPAARLIAARAIEPLPALILRWADLARPDGDADFAALAGFVRDHPDWPNRGALERQAERVMPPDLPKTSVVAWFQAHPPVTEPGLARFVAALDDRSRAVAVLRNHWIAGSFEAGEEQDLLSRFGGLLGPADHGARLDRLLWSGNAAAARRMMALVDPGHRTLADIRLAVQGGAPRDEGAVQALMQRLPVGLGRDPGLRYDLARWYRRHDDAEAAVEVLRTRPEDPAHLTAWWGEINALARWDLDHDDAAGALALVENPGPLDPAGTAQAALLAGWIALTRLHDPARAGQAFAALWQGADLPASRARAAYWQGRAAAALGDRDGAARWYETAAGWPLFFYGRLGAAALGRGAPVELPPDPLVPAEAAAAFEAKETVRAARMIAAIDGDAEREGLFLRRISLDAAGPAELALAERLALGLGRPDVAVATARQAAARDHGAGDPGSPLVGVALGAASFPVLAVSMPPEPEPALIHALIRQESGFSQTVISSAGAMGLMQLMPSTAQRAAARLGLPASVPRLTADAGYNIRLGSGYLEELLDRFGGSYVLAVAAYNAGPARVQEWIDRFGDPRGTGDRAVDWIEGIPFTETRLYVQRVLEALPVYRGRLGQAPGSFLGDLER